MSASRDPLAALANDLAEMYSWRSKPLRLRSIGLQPKCPLFVPRQRGALPPTVRQHDRLSPELASPYSVRKYHAADLVPYRSTATSSLDHLSKLEARIPEVPSHTRAGPSPRSSWPLRC